MIGGTLLLVIVASAIGLAYRNHQVDAELAASQSIKVSKPTYIIHHEPVEPVTTKTATTNTTTTPTTVTPTSTACANNTLSQFISVSISQRHLWACEGSKQVYDSPVITGMENLAADLTPTGTYHIYSKQTDLYLKGSDSTGSWNDYVYYWMPFLSNQYGTYGFHDATWRQDDAFGNVSPDSTDASHGCVELPLATAKWIYDWSNIGTTLTITS